jgi:hypothetical protein
MFFDDIKTLYDLGAPETGTIRSSRPTATIAGDKAKLDSLAYLALQDLESDRSGYREGVRAGESRC